MMAGKDWICGAWTSSSDVQAVKKSRISCENITSNFVKCLRHLSLERYALSNLNICIPQS